MSDTWRSLGRAFRAVVQDRHDGVAYVGTVVLTTGVWETFGRGWALMVLGLVLLALTWKGLR